MNSTAAEADNSEVAQPKELAELLHNPAKLQALRQQQRLSREAKLRRALSGAPGLTEDGADYFDDAPRDLLIQ